MSDREMMVDGEIGQLEVIEFLVGAQSFGISMKQVREVLQAMNVTSSPHSHPSMEGMIHVRELVIPLVDLAHYLGLPASASPAEDKYIIAEVDELLVAFHVHDIVHIHRVSSTQVDKPSALFQTQHSATAGVIKLEDKLVLLLDFDKIVADINPEGEE